MFEKLKLWKIDYGQREKLLCFSENNFSLFEGKSFFMSLFFVFRHYSSAIFPDHSPQRLAGHLPLEKTNSWPPSTEEGDHFSKMVGRLPSLVKSDWPGADFVFEVDQIKIRIFHPFLFCPFSKKLIKDTKTIFYSVKTL